MEALVETLREVERVLGDAVGETFASGELRVSDDEALLALLAQVSALSRLADALLVEVVAHVQERADAAPHAARITARFGCRSMTELVQRATRLSSRTAGDLLRGARAVAQTSSPTSGEVLPASYPAMRAALADGAVGLGGLVAVTSALDAAGCALEARLAADEELAAAARGDGCDGGPAACADELRAQAQVWAMYLDQDGSEPREARALRRRALTVGVCRDGLVPVRGNLLPEVAGQLDTLFHSILNPKGGGPEAPDGPHFTETEPTDPDTPLESLADPRTRTQRQHDALATILSAAARAGDLPTIGGAAPTLVVSASAEDLRTGNGHAHLDGCEEPVPLAVARQAACSGAIQRVLTDEDGRVRAIHTFDRVFGPHQRKAIVLRDGGCVIPGCHVPAAWCEIHHVEEHSRGGPTHTDNGVLLCWHHHRTLDSGGWKIRMRNGIPEVRGPYWWDASLKWRAVTTSPLRRRRRLAERRASGP